MSGYARLAALMAGAAAIAAILAPSASASSGEITRALANSSRTEASVAGSITWTGCEHPAPVGPLEPFPPIKPKPGEPIPSKEVWPNLPCNWTPFVTLGPGTADADCSAPGRQDPDSLGEGVTLVWLGFTRSGAGADQFDVGGIPLGGGANQLLCLSAVELGAQKTWIVCPAVVGFECPPAQYRSVEFAHALAGSLLSPLPAAIGSGAALFSGPEPPPEPPRQRRRCKKHKADGKTHARRAVCKRSRHKKHPAM
ncbi:MAG TPA: hypothetical protein VFJ57_09645 [Solirubrobacterales bacterium]|nr:hypothetical protein [Solirubrobacterales bacterium]